MSAPRTDRRVLSPDCLAQVRGSGDRWECYTGNASLAPTGKRQALMQAARHNAVYGHLMTDGRA